MKILNYSKVLVLMLAMVFITSQTMAQVPPKHIQPEDYATCQSTKMTFKWEVPISYEHFTLEVSLTEDFSESVTEYENIESTSFSTTLAKYDTTYYWRVTVYYTNESIMVSQPTRFFTNSVEPVALSPADGLQCVYHNKDILTFKWSDVAEKYNLQLSTDSNFTNIVLNSSLLSDTSYQVTAEDFTNANQMYYWRVRGMNKSCGTDFSNVMSFKTAPVAPTIIAPENGAKGIPLFTDVPFAIRFEWKRDIEALYYELQLDESPLFTSPVIDASNIYSSYLDTNLSDEYNKRYYWRVRAVYENCTTLWRAAGSFRTPFNANNPLIPADNDECYPQNAKFVWERIDNAGEYRIQVSADPGFTMLIHDIAGIAATTITLDLPQANQKYYWRYRAEDNNNIGIWSEINEFTTAIAPPITQAPAHLSGGVSLMPTFRWQNFGADSKYKLMIAADPAFGKIIEQVSVDTNFVTINLDSNNMYYYWKVQAKVGFCESSFSEVSAFKTIVGVATLIEPENKSTLQPLNPTFTWESVPGAIKYDVQLATDVDFTAIVEEKYSHEEKNIRFSLLKLSENTKYFWRVRAGDEFARGAWSNTFEFTTGYNIPNAPKLISPLNDEIKVPRNVDFVWEEVEGAVTYELRISKNSYFNGSDIYADLTENTLQIDDLINYQTYYWKVKAINESGESNWSNTFNFRIIDIPPTATPGAIEPNDGAIDVPLNALIEWSAVDHAKFYHLQVSTDKTFTDENMFLNLQKVGSNTRYANGLKANTTYYWRVKGWNEAGETQWSQIFSFTTEIPVSVIDATQHPFSSHIYPNPANRDAVIEFTLSTEAEADIILFNSIGSEIMRLSGGNSYPAGLNRVEFSLDGISAGTYIYVIKAGNLTEAGKIVKE